jgi:uncharacterized protein (DUF2147 family)
MRRAALALLASGSILFAAAPAFAAFGAIAYDKAAGKAGWSWGKPTEKGAEEAALSRCGTGACKVIMRFGPRFCAALATTKDGKHAGAASRKTPDQARVAALTDCKKSHAGECVIRATPCNR